MKTHVLKGTKQQIARELTQIPGEVCEAIVFVKDPTSDGPEHPGSDDEDIFAEMRPFMVNVPFVDDSREAIYTRLEGE